MKSDHAILGVVSCAALVGGAIWLGIQHQASRRLRTANEALRQQLSQAASLVAENERLLRLVAQTNGPHSLPDAQLKELLRLRGEVGRLRQQTKELGALREENDRARAALEASLKTRSAVPAGSAATADYWPRESWAFAGYASPDAALRSAFWAANQGDVKTFLSGMTGDVLKHLEEDFKTKSEDEIAAQTKAEVAQMTSVQVLNREVQSEDTVVLTAMFDKGGRTETAKLLMKKLGNDWKLYGHL